MRRSISKSVTGCLSVDLTCSESEKDLVSFRYVRSFMLFSTIKTSQ